MKRRTFLYNTSLGTLGFSFFSGFPSRIFQHSFAASLDVFLQNVGARPLSLTEADSFLEKACKRAAVNREMTGYRALDHQVFLYRKGTRAIHLLQLTHEKLGTLDISATFFEHAATVEKWQLISPLSGFQLEALVKAAEALRPARRPGELADLLLPSPRRAKKTPGRFLTELGEVAVSASLEKNKSIKVKAAVYEANQTIWSSEYTSQYLQSL